MSADDNTGAALKAMRESFRIFDTDKSGFIEHHELNALLKKLASIFKTEDPSDKEIQTIFEELDENGDGRISKEEFEKLIEEIVKIVKEESCSQIGSKSSE